MGDQQAIDRPPARGISQAWTATILLLALYVLTMPRWQPALIDYATLDGSWQAVIADAAFQPVQFGRDLVYTVGPYGWLRSGVYWPGLFWAILAWGLFASSVLAAVFAVMVRGLGSRRLWSSFLLFALFPILASGRVISMIYLFDCLILFCSLTVDRRDERYLAVLAGPFLALSSLVFFPQMVAAAGTAVFFSLVFFLRFRRLSWIVPLYASGGIIWWLIARQSILTLPAYLRTSIEQTRGYADVMSNNGPLIEVAAIIVLALGVVGLVVFSRRGCDPPTTVFLAAGLAFLFFLSFKHAVIRHQTGRLILPDLTIFGAAVAQLVWLAHTRPARWQRWRGVASGTVAVVLISTLVMTAQRQPGDTGSGCIRKMLLPVTQARKLLQLIGKPEALATWDAQRRAEIRSEFPLPAITGTVDYYGDRQGILIAHDLEYRPRPLFQRMIANTPMLAAMNREFYGSASAPETVIVDLTGFGRVLRPQLDPLVFVNLLEDYEPVQNNSKLAVVVRGEPRPFGHERVLEVSAIAGQWVSIAEHSSSGPIWLEVEATPTIRGKVLGSFYKRPALSVELKFRKGKNSTHRFAANTARAGFWLSPTIQNSRQFVQFMEKGFSGAGRNRVVTDFRIFDPSGDPSRVWGEIEIRADRLLRPDDEG